MMNDQLDGVLTALITPTSENGRVDEGAVRELVEFQVGIGVAGLFVLGSAGQGPMLTETERAELAGTLVDAADGRLKVVVHVGALPQSVAVSLARQAKDVGANAISTIPPVYYQPDFQAVSNYYHVIRSTVGDELPVLAYNNPPATGYDLRPHEAVTLHADGVIDGVKQASASISDLASLLAADVPVWMANAGCNLAAAAMGARGVISTITNVVPELFVKLHEAVQRRDLYAARDAQQRIDWAASGLRNPIIGALHAACSLRGLPGGLPRAPLRMPDDDEMLAIRESLDALDGDRQ